MERRVDLQGQFEELGEAVAPYGFGEIGEDSDLLLRCCAAIIAGDASPGAIVNLKGEVVRARFAEIKTGIRGAIDFLRSNLHVYSAGVLPFTTLLIPLSVFFATDRDQSTHPDAGQRERLVRWVWRTFFTRRYSKRLEQLNQDIREVAQLRSGDPGCALGEFPAGVTEGFFTDNTFSIRNVDTKTFVLLLASAGPLDFVGGGRVALDAVLRECNKKEFHHLYPRAYLKVRNVPDGRIDALVNICLLPRAANNRIGDFGPSEYARLMPVDPAMRGDVLRSAVCPDSLFGDDFGQFTRDRAARLVRRAKELMRV